MNKDKLYEMAQDINIEQLLRSDWDYFLEHLNLTKDMTVSDFAKALTTCSSYDWPVTANELLEYWEAMR